MKKQVDTATTLSPLEVDDSLEPAPSNPVDEPAPHLAKKPLIEVGLILIAIILIASGIGWIYHQKQQYATTFYPEVYINEERVTGKTPAEVEKLLAEKSAPQFEQLITLQADGVSVSSSAADLNIQLDYKNAIDQAYKVGHEKFFWDGALRLIFNKPPKQAFTTQITVDESKVKELITLLKTKVDKPSVAPTAVLGTSGKVATLKINEGKNGLEIHEDEATAEVKETIIGGGSTILLETATVSAQLNVDQVKAASDRAGKLIGKQLTFTANDITEQLNDQKIIALLKLPEGIEDEKVGVLADTWNKTINRPPRNAVFTYDKETLKVSEFVPPQNGLAIQKADLQSLVTSAISELEKTDEKSKVVSVPVKETPPDVTLASTNDLGIVEQIGVGDSEYFHSIPGRIHNVGLTSTRINNTIVKPGEEFSFNKTLGDVSAASGFAPAYVIKNGRTELGDGGGVCQVSTTVFRAVLNAGLLVTKRIPHSYRVSYYELNSKPGIDATVYAGEVDFRFKNDTGHAILIRTENDPKKLYLAVRIYGTSDGRSTEIISHTTSNPQPAPPALYQDDPSLPRGTTKQIDFAASGIKATFVNVIKDKDGKEIRRDTYNSNYKPWQAVYLVGTGG